MVNLRLLIGKYSQFLKFCIVGLFNTLISVVVFNFLIYFGVNYLLATVVGYLAGLVNAYFFSSRFVFKSKAETSSALRFLVVYLSALIINLVLMYFMVNVGKVNPSLGQLVVTCFNVGYNFTLNKLWTFRDK